MTEKINHIKIKLQLLIKQYQQLQKENLQLKNQVDKQVDLIKQQNHTIQQQQQKMDIVQIKNAQLTKEEKQVLEKRIDGYLKEINTCLSLLNKD